MGLKLLFSRTLLSCVIVLLSLYQVRIFASNSQIVTTKLIKIEGNFGIDLSALKSYSNELVFLFGLLGVFSGLLLMFNQGLVKLTFFIFLAFAIGFNTLEIPCCFPMLKTAVFNGTLNTSVLSFISICGAIIGTQ